MACWMARLAMPCTSGTNFGFDVFPSTIQGMPSLLLPSRRPAPSFDLLLSSAAILKLRAPEALTVPSESRPRLLGRLPAKGSISGETPGSASRPDVPLWQLVSLAGGGCRNHQIAF